MLGFSNGVKGNWMALAIDFFLKLSILKKVFILILILGVITGLYAYVFFIPVRSELEGQKSELNKLTKELSESKALTKDLQKYKEQVEKMNTELTDALTQLPNEKEIPDILKNISRLGKESSLEFTLFRPKAEEPQQFYAKVPIDLVVVGSYHNIGIFFDKMSKLPRIINVVDFSMTKAKDIKVKETEVLVKTSCLVNTYRFIEKGTGEKKDEKKTPPEGKEEGESTHRTFKTF